jgi:6,7-dimethyl-8-ribityllumazine synthase
VQVIEGSLQNAAGARFVLVASRFNDLVVDALIRGARGALVAHGIKDDHITLVRVPGAWEIPWACRRVVERGRVDAIVALGAVVRGSTPHFDYVAGEVAKGVGRLMFESGVVTTFGVLTTDTMEQALDRAGGKAGNKGADAALAALELLALNAALKAPGA